MVHSVLPYVSRHAYLIRTFKMFILKSQGIKRKRTHYSTVNAGRPQVFSQRLLPLPVSRGWGSVRGGRGGEGFFFSPWHLPYLLQRDTSPHVIAFGVSCPPRCPGPPARVWWGAAGRGQLRGAGVLLLRSTGHGEDAPQFWKHSPGMPCSWLLGIGVLLRPPCEPGGPCPFFALRTCSEPSFWPRSAFGGHQEVKGQGDK